MSCAETMENMQRDLDNDLTEKQYLAMEQHLNQCPECQKIYTNLKSLSLNLENLPQVKPPYSLVDEILPQLIEEAPEDKLITEDDRVSKRLHEMKTARWKSWSIVAGGLAAACMWVLSDKIFTTSDLKDQMIRSESALEGKMLDDRTTERSEPTGDREDSTPTENQSKSIDDTLLAKEQGSGDKSLNKDVERNRQPAKEEVKQEPQAASESKPETKPNPQPNASTEQETVQQREPSKTEERIDKNGVESDKDKALALAPETSPQQRSAESKSSLLASPLPEKLMNRAMISLPEQDNGITSPDGQWIARVQEDRIVITNRAGTEVFRTDAWGIEAQASFEWIDGTHLQYRLESADSKQSETWLIDVKEKQVVKK
ncbi:hypothetical protein BEP19_06045 [Ammoniphilus oxalaticus]|uniref:Putative zinc-finger domain-containing protein n=1 Tax=Ammoniphilus oxalaticus TaxID=66863 RepID=A0A419SJ93_9BACL|nr:zf-HC2 domain-containing protein [Ammoniphilus oxalaticus]RKD23978.1 hypothetical protein BEP19_06045 [Ammoniphilus oxalaticus]